MATAPNYLGSMWSPIVPANRHGGINIISGEETVAAGIIMLCLTRRGEDAYNPDYGLDLDLFGRIEDVDPDFWASQVAEAIWKWVPGVAGIRVELTADSAAGKLSAQILYKTRNSLAENTLTVPYHLYTGAIYYSDTQTFLDSISLNGNNFRGF